MKSSALSLMVLILLILLLISPTDVRAQSPGLNVTPSVIEPGRNITLHVYGLVGQKRASFYLIASSGKLVLSKEILLRSVNGEAAVSLRIPGDIAPGRYTVKLSSKGFNLLGDLWVAPSRRNLARLWEQISEVKVLFSEVSEIRTENWSRINLTIGRIMVEARGLSLKSKFEVKDVENYQSLLKRVSSVKSELEGFYSRSFLQRVLVQIEKSLNFNPSISVEFWSRVSRMSVLVLLMVLAMLPIIISDFDVILQNVVSMARDDVKEKVKMIAINKAKNMLYAAERDAEISVAGYLLMVVSTVLATTGLLTNSVVTIIGSMLMAPLLTVMISSGVSLSFLNLDHENLGQRAKEVLVRSLERGLALALISVIVAYISSSVSSEVLPLAATTEIMKRAMPNLSDVAVAATAGLAGSIVFVRREYGALTGVAIAIALVPPAATVGIGIAMARVDITLGALALLTINVVAIISLSYLSSKFYVLTLSLLPALESRLEDAGQYGFLKYPVALLTNFKELVIVWIRSTMGLLPETSPNLRILEREIWKFTKLLLIVMSPSILAFVISTNVSSLFTGVLGVFGRIYDPITKLPFSEYILLILLMALIGILLRVHLRKSRKNRMPVELLILVLIWGTVGYLLRLDMFPRSAAILTMLFAGIVYLTKAKNKAVLLGYGLAIFALTISFVYTVGVFNKATVASIYENPHLEVLCKEAVAGIFNINESNVEVSYPRSQNYLLIKIFVSHKELDRGWKLPSKAISLAEETIRVLLSPDVKIRFEYVITP